MTPGHAERVKSAIARRARTRVQKVSARLSNARRPVILMYHRIAKETFDPWGLAVAPDRFAGQLAWLAKHRTLLPLSEFAELQRLGTLPGDAVAVTFDDGYACTASVAAPLLERYGVPATIFIPADMIGGTRLFWWDELAQIVIAHSAPTLRAMNRSFELGDKHDRDAVWPRDNRKRTPRQKSFHALWAELQPLPPDAIDRALAELRLQHPVTSDNGSHRLITERELRSIRSDRIQFGSHALTHTSLPSLTSAEKAREIRDSVAACEELTGTRPTTFAYPFGDLDRECQELVAEAGFACACGVQPRAVATNDDLFALPRIKVENWSWRELRQRLADVSYEADKAQLSA